MIVSVFVFVFVFLCDDDNGDDEKHHGCNQDNGVIGLPLVVAVTIIITIATGLLLLYVKTLASKLPFEKIGSSMK